MIRAILLFNGLCNPQLVERCSVVLALQRGKVCEIWVRCSCAEDMFMDIEVAVNKGYLLEEVVFLTGLKVKGYAINKEIVEANESSKQSIEGLVEFEFYTPVKNWIGNLNIKRISIDVKNRKALALLEKPVNIEYLFDLGIRLLKPKKVSP